MRAAIKALEELEVEVERLKAEIRVLQQGSSMPMPDPSEKVEAL